MNRIINSDKQAKKLISQWQKVMDLEGWRIQFFFEPRLESNIRGRCYWEGGLKDATILLNPKDSIWTNKYPMERTIIHELCHLIFAKMGDPCPDEIETAVGYLTTIFFNIKKSKQKHLTKVQD